MFLPFISQVTAEYEDEFRQRAQDSRTRAFRQALKLTHNIADAEDLVQETYVKAWRGYGSYLSHLPFTSWILRIMTRAYLDNRRRENPVRRAESLELHNEYCGEWDAETLGPQTLDPHQRLLQAELRRELHHALAKLPAVYRRAIEMCDLQKLTYSEIAEIENTTIGTIRSRIHRGRTILRQHLQKIAEDN